MAKYYITKKAVEDLDSIWEYTCETWSEKQADTYYEALITTFESIANKPGFLDKEYKEVQVGLFCRRCKKHMVFYRILSDVEVKIIRILHQSMDISSKF